MLEALRVASTAWPLMLVGCWPTGNLRGNLVRVSAHHLTAPRVLRYEAVRDSGAPTGGSERNVKARRVWVETNNSKLSAGWMENSKSEIRNPKFLGMDVRHS